MGIPIKEDINTYQRGQVGFGIQEIVASRFIQSDAAAGTYVFPSADGECDIPTLAANITDDDDGGFLVYMAAAEANANGLEYAAGDQARILREGYIVVQTEVNVVDQDPVYVRVAVDGGLTNIGGCSNIAGTGLALLPGARFSRTSTSNLALVRVR